LDGVIYVTYRRIPAKISREERKRERKRDRERGRERRRGDRENQAASGERKEQVWYRNVCVYFAKEKRGRSNGGE